MTKHIKRICFIASALLLSAVFFTSCIYIPKTADDLLDFTGDDAGVIVLDGTEYNAYAIIEKRDLGEQIGIVNGDKKDRVYKFRDYDTGEFIAEMYVSGEMDVAMLYRAKDCDIEPHGVYIPDDE